MENSQNGQRDDSLLGGRERCGGTAEEPIHAETLADRHTAETVILPDKAVIEVLPAFAGG
jgi:hypothetical protein